MHKKVLLAFVSTFFMLPLSAGAQEEISQKVPAPAEVKLVIEEIPANERINEDKSKELLILFTNSTNGYLESCGCPMRPHGGLYKVAPYIESMRKEHPNTLVLDSGDICYPYLPQRLLKYILRAYNRIKYDAVAIGDNELSSQVSCDQILKSGVHFLSSNLSYEKGNKFIAAGPDKRIFEKSGIKIAVISVIDPETVANYPETITKKLQISPPDEFLSKFFAENEKYDIVVLISHGDLEKSKALAAKFPGIGVIIGGHQYNHLSMPVKVGETLIVQAGTNAQHVGKLTLRFDENKQWSLLDYDIKIISIDLPTDSHILGLSKKYKKYAKKLYNNDVGKKGLPR